jgi:hypothetical protein
MKMELNMQAKKPKATKNLVHVGTHVPMTTKMTLQAMAESQDKSLYELLQEVAIDMAEKYEAEVEELRKRQPKKAVEAPAEVPAPTDSGDELLG